MSAPAEDRTRTKTNKHMTNSTTTPRSQRDSAPVIHFPTKEEKQALLDGFFAEQRKINQEGRAAVEAAIPAVEVVPRREPGRGGGMNKPDFTPFWCLMGYDQHGSRMYACGPGGPFDPAHRFPSTIGALSHRPHEARKFASEAEALAALPDLAPWIEAYVRDWLRRDSKSGFTVTLPLRAYFENDLVCIHADGSGLAREEMRRNMAWIHEEEEALRTLRAFVQKHQGRLEGLSWTVSKWSSQGGPAVTFSGPPYCAYRGANATCAEIAALWPVEWRRKTPTYPDRDYLQYDWVASLDGVTLRIPIAESTRIVPQKLGDMDGTKVKLGKAVAA